MTSTVSTWLGSAARYQAVSELLSRRDSTTGTRELRQGLTTPSFLLSSTLDTLRSST